MKLISLGLIAISLTACAPSAPRAPDKYDFEDTIKNQMRDPGSIKFIDETIYPNGNGYTMCGTLNAKNGFGGYGGATRFIAGESVILENDTDGSLFRALWAKTCHY